MEITPNSGYSEDVVLASIGRSDIKVFDPEIPENVTFISGLSKLQRKEGFYGGKLQGVEGIEKKYGNVDCLSAEINELVQQQLAEVNSSPSNNNGHGAILERSFIDERTGSFCCDPDDVSCILDEDAFILPTQASQAVASSVGIEKISKSMKFNGKRTHLPKRDKTNLKGLEDKWEQRDFIESQDI